MATTTTTPALERRIREALNSIGVKVKDLTDEQRARAISAPSEQPELTGKAVARWIMTDPEPQPEPQPEPERQAEAPERKKHVTAANDPEAGALAAEAKKFAGVKSPFGPGEARTFLDEFGVDNGGERQYGKCVQVTHGDASLELSLEQVAAFAKGERVVGHGDQLDDDAKRAVRKAMVDLGQGTVLWGRKLAAFIAVRGGAS